MLYSVFIGIYNSLFLGCSRILSNYTVRNLFRKYIMAASLQIQSNTLIEVSLDPKLVTEGNVGLPTQKGSIDMVVIGYGDFVSGTYKDINPEGGGDDIESNVSVVASNIHNMAYEHSTTVPANSDITLTAYVNTPNPADLMVVGKPTIRARSYDGSGNTNKITFGENKNWYASYDVWSNDDANLFETTEVKHSNDRLGGMLVEAVSAALFRKYGRYVAILNDDVIKGKQSDISTAVGNFLNETNEDAATSMVFKHYLDSGRYQEDGPDREAAGADQRIPYNFNDAEFDFVVKVSGTVKNGDAVIDSALIQPALGTGHKVSSAEGSVGQYSMNIFLRLIQKDLLA